MLITQQPGSIAPELLSQADNWFTFHLLSEGDAGVLGKYNAHFSDDILSHLIGEPIPGNCYMWSAPKQPFVLPVRIKSFEGLYRQFVRVDPSESAVANTLAGQIALAVAGATKRLAAALKDKLNAPKVKYQRLGSGDDVGVKDGQLYYLVKEIKDPSDTSHEDQLKQLLLDELLGVGVVKLVEHEGTKYWSASAGQWKLAGISPRV